MSFYINNSNPSRPGPLSGNVTGGLCEKVLIETRKVFDACVSQSTETGIVLPLTDLTPADPALPLTYVSSENTPGATFEISDLVIERLETAPNYANVSFSVNVPVTVYYRDSNGVLGQGTSSVTINKSVILFVPQPSISPISITASGAFNSSIGTYTSENTFTVTACIEIIIKVVATVDILVPSYGYPVVPPCQSAPNPTCPGTFEQPLYPTATNNINLPRV